MTPVNDAVKKSHLRGFMLSHFSVGARWPFCAKFIWSLGKNYFICMGFPGGSGDKESTCNAGDLGWIPELRSSPGGGHGNPIQPSCLENPHGQRSLVGCSPWGYKKLDTTERLNTAFHIHTGRRSKDVVLGLHWAQSQEQVVQWSFWNLIQSDSDLARLEWDLRVCILNGHTRGIWWQWSEDYTHRKGDVKAYFQPENLFNWGGDPQSVVTEQPSITWELVRKASSDLLSQNVWE